MENFRKNFLEKIEDSKDILLVTHINPDIDGTCSCLALKDFLEKNYPKKKIYLEEHHTNNSFLYPEIEVNELEKINFDLCIISDCYELNKCILKESKEAINNSKNVFVIDHHERHRKESWSKNTNLFLDSNYSSCCELILEIIGIENFTNYGLEKIMDGITSDSLSFRRANKKTFANIYKISSRGINVGDSIARIDNLLVNRLKEMGKIGNTFLKDGKFQIHLGEEDVKLKNFLIYNMIPKLSYMKKLENGLYQKNPIEMCLIMQNSKKRWYPVTVIFNRKPKKNEITLIKKYEMKSLNDNIFAKNFSDCSEANKAIQSLWFL